jgi:ribosomal-protein-alanine N-acetyltransferase
MGADDVAEVAALARATLPEAWDAAGLAAEIAKTTSRAIVALDGTRIVAFAIGSLVMEELEVLSIAVSPDARRAGVGRTLLRSLARGARTAHLEVRASNDAAIALYASLGFAVVGRRSRYYSDGEDAVRMSLTASATST